MGAHIAFGADPLALMSASALASALASASQFLLCTITCEPVVGFLPIFHGFIT